MPVGAASFGGVHLGFAPATSGQPGRHNDSQLESVVRGREKVYPAGPKREAVDRGGLDRDRAPVIFRAWTWVLFAGLRLG